ncbi:MAG TPA: response regulator [Gaiellaceae bacterium]
MTEYVGASPLPGVRLRAIFAADCRRRLALMRESCAGLDGRPDERSAAVSALAEEAHAIRGGAAVVELRQATETVAALEELLAGAAPDAAAVTHLLDELETALPAADGAPPLGEIVSAAPGAAATLVHVDDDVTCRAVVERLLGMRPHVRLVPVTVAQDADLVVRDEGPALVLLDLHLGSESGWEVLRAIRAEARTRDVPVVVLSADGSDGVDATTRSLITARLQKPFSAEAFFALIDRFAPAP